MNTPRRIQRKRTKGWTMPEGAIYVGRPTKWGNPFKVVAHDGLDAVDYWIETPDGKRWLDRPLSAHQAHAVAVELFETHIGAMGSYEYEAEQWQELGALAGRDFVCWCPLDRPCHADVLLEIANGDNE